MAIRLQGNAIDLSVWKPPQREVASPSGEMVTEKLPSQRSKLMLSPSGHAVWVALHNGSGNRNPMDPVALRVEREKKEKGFLLFGSCPQSIDSEYSRFVPESLQGRPACKTAADGHPISNAHPCKCMLELQKIRANGNAKKMSEIENRGRSREMRQNEMKELEIELLKKQNDLLAASKEQGKK